MEYALAGAVTALFVVIYILSRPKERERFSEAEDEETFKAHAKSVARSLPAPSDGGSPPDTAAAKRRVLRALSLSGEKCDDPEAARLLNILNDRKNELKSLAKQDFSVLQTLPYVEGEARCVAVARTVLEPSRYIFCAERAEIVLDAFNAVRTLTFAETEQMRTAFEFVLLEKLSFLCARITTADKLRRAALRVARHPRLLGGKKRCRILRGTVFSLFCAGELGYDTATFRERYRTVTDETAFYLNNVIDSLDNVALFDFSAFYEPCGLLARFDAYASAPAQTRAAFAKKLGELSTRENLDEYAYAVRLASFGDYGRLPPLKALRAHVGGGSIVIMHFDDDLIMPARALSSPEMMEILFGHREKSGSIIKNAKIKSSFMPKIRNDLAACGLVLNGDRLSLGAPLPKETESADFVLVHRGVKHRVHIERGDECVFVNGTKMTGVPSVTLGERPLDIRFFTK